jgi:uncharacterized membrane protein HdeD (DUF308 family)
LLSLVTLFALYLIIDGVLEIVSAVRAARRQQGWGFLTFEGIVGILAGIIALALPGLTVLVFVGLVAAWAFITGALELRAAYRLERDHGRWWMALGGIISVMFGIVLIAAPFSGALVVLGSICEKNRCIFERVNLRFTAGELSLAKAWT